MAQVKEKDYIKTKNKFNYFSIKPQVLRLLRDEGFTRPTKVQEESLTITLQNNLRQLCIIVYAYNGAGKTLTYIIPVLNSLQMLPYMGAKYIVKADDYNQICKPQAIIVLPTQPLMDQVYEYMRSYAQYYEANFKWPLKVVMVHGNKSKKDMQGHILVCMPKKMVNQINKYDFSELKWAIFDECDKIKDDHPQEFTNLLKQITQSSNANLIITSATGDKATFREYVQKNLSTHNVVQLDSKEQNKGLEGVTHYYSQAKNKDQVILNILGLIADLQSKPQVIIFFNEVKQLNAFYDLLKKQKTRFVVNDLQADLKKKNNLQINYVHGRVGVHLPGLIHRCPQDCKLTKSQRTALLKNGQIQVLLGTQTIGRGIDIRTVSLVINYSEPKKNKQEFGPITYIHRVGRTGRYVDQGIALTFISDPKFISLTEQDQKIKFKQMDSQEQIVKQTLECSKKNEELKQGAKLRYEAQQ